MGKIWVRRLTLIGVLLIVGIDSHEVQASALQAEQGTVSMQLKGETILVGCMPERLVVRPGEHIKLQAWVSGEKETDTAQSVQFNWKPEAGRIDGSGESVTWFIDGQRGVKRTASVNVRTDAANVGECQLAVVVEAEPSAECTPADEEAGRCTRKDQTRGVSETARAFLRENQQEGEGYGLYSYFLLGGKPTDAQKSTIIQALEAYLALIIELAELENYFDLTQINVTYLPIKAPGMPKQQAVVAQWLLEHYDFARARSILNNVDQNLREGPYLIATQKRLTARAEEAYLKLDLSAVDPEDIPLFVKRYIVLAAQEKDWFNMEQLKLFALQFRGMLKTLARGGQMVTQAIESVVEFSQKSKK